MEGGIRRAGLDEPGLGVLEGVESRILCRDPWRLGAMVILKRGLGHGGAVWLQGELGCHQHAGDRRWSVWIPPGGCTVTQLDVTLQNSGHREQEKRGGGEQVQVGVEGQQVAPVLCQKSEKLCVRRAGKIAITFRK